MVPDTRLRINRPQVIDETFADEAVVVNLANGNYYTLSRVGAEVWQCLEQGFAPARIVEELCARYAGPQAEIATAVAQFVDALLAAALVVPATDTDTPAPPPPALPSPAVPAPVRPAFQPPVMQEYTDMQGLLLVDPVHEVDETGWPNVKREGGTP